MMCVLAKVQNLPPTRNLNSKRHKAIEFALSTLQYSNHYTGSILSLIVKLVLKTIYPD